MIYGSVCSGIEAVTVAWEPLGWKAAWFAEIDPFASAVLMHHYPTVPNLGGFTKIGEEHGRVEFLVGGTPCQSFSVAGRRAGLDEPRGVLAFEFLRLAEQLRPRWVLFENVPGLLSSRKGRDFGSWLGTLEKCGYGWAYWTLDAQFTGVPQRRRRVFVVGYLGDWRVATAVLFERHSLSGDPPPSREAGEEVARSLRARSNDSHRADSMIYVPQTAGTLEAPRCPRYDGETETFIAHTLRSEGADASEDGTGRGTPLVFDWYSSESQSLPVTEECPPLKGSMQPAVVTCRAPIDTLQQQWYNTGGGDEDVATHQADTREVLLALRQAVGEEAFQEWGLGVLTALRQTQVLREGMYGSELRPEGNQTRSGVDDGALPREEGSAAGSVWEMWVSGCIRCASQEWGLAGQIARELRAYLSQLSHEGASRSTALRGMWQASEGLGLLRQALSEIQGYWRPAEDEDPTAKDVHDLRRASAQQEPLRETLHAGQESGDTPSVTDSRRQGGAGLAVRRLTPL